MKTKAMAVLKRYLMITLGCLIYAAGIAFFLDPNQLAPGGVTGIAIIISHISGVQTGTLTFCINVPLMLFGLWKFGKGFFVSTFYAAAVSSGFMNLINVFTKGASVVTDNLILAGIVGGVLLALGMGLIFREGATTAGTDIIVRALRQKYPHIKTGSLFMITDAVVITASAIVFQNIEIALFAALSLVISSMFLDVVLYGTDEAKLLHIISAHSERIAGRILDEIDIGATFLKGEGAYTNDDKKVLMCVVRKYNFMKVREIIRREDPDAFVIISKASEVFGEGYKDHFEQEV